MKKSSFGYEMKAKSMKQMHECVKNMTNVTKTSHLGMKKNHGGTEPDNFIPHFIPNRYEIPAQGIKTAHLGMK
jgi:hypothetical protein